MKILYFLVLIFITFEGLLAEVTPAPGLNPKLTEITFEADSSLTSRGFKCTSDWCQSYCTKKSGGRKFDSACDETQSCHCKFELPPGLSTNGMVLKNVTMIGVSNKTAPIHAKHVANMTKAECTPQWCDDYCKVKSNGRKYEAKCDSPLSCACEFPRQPLKDGDKAGNMMVKKFHCTQQWCSDYCDSKANGRKFIATCDENEACKCVFPWRKTMHSVTSMAGPAK